MSTCDHICRECGQIMNCQHCRPYSLPKDRFRIAELEALIRDCDNRLREHGDTTLHPLRERIYRAIGVPTVRSAA